VRLVLQTSVLNLETGGGANKCLLRVDAKQDLQWITHGTFEKRTVQSQMFLGYLQFNDFGSVWGHGPTLIAGLSKRVDLKLVSRLEFGSGAMRYEPRR
jgi:hypothetical protein